MRIRLRCRYAGLCNVRFIVAQCFWRPSPGQDPRLRLTTEGPWADLGGSAQIAVSVAYGKMRQKAVRNCILTIRNELILDFVLSNFVANTRGACNI
jgi:hypothetical protein